MLFSFACHNAADTMTRMTETDEACCTHWVVNELQFLRQSICFVQNNPAQHALLDDYKG